MEANSNSYIIIPLNLLSFLWNLDEMVERIPFYILTPFYEAKIRKYLKCCIIIPPVYGKTKNEADEQKYNIQTSILLREEYWNLCKITSGGAMWNTGCQ